MSNELKNEELHANEINEDELSISGGRIIETGEGDKKEYFVIPDYMKPYKTKEEAEKANNFFKQFRFGPHHHRHPRPGLHFAHDRPMPEDAIDIIKKHLEITPKTPTNLVKPTADDINGTK